MKLEHQVTNLEISKRLKELGVKQESLFYWVADILVFKTQTGFFTIRGAGMNLHPLADKAISAFTCAELGEMLPEPTDEKHYVVMKDGNQWCLWETEDGFYDKDGNHVYADTEADARGKMLIYLIENGLLKV